jgi:hypothetical protein
MPSIPFKDNFGNLHKVAGTSNGHGIIPGIRFRGSFEQKLSICLEETDKYLFGEIGKFVDVLWIEETDRDHIQERGIPGQIAVLSS